MNLHVAAFRQNAAIPTPATMRRSAETPLRFMAPMRVRKAWKLPLNVFAQGGDKSAALQTLREVG
ncbi:MAG: hypothetical protein KIS67_13900 [Verrucomicrobiae bacterium]|nr:hypothetical protein [Verrucomicrobiae bacterium]